MGSLVQNGIAVAIVVVSPLALRAIVESVIAIWSLKTKDMGRRQHALVLLALLRGLRLRIPVRRRPP